MLTEQKFGSLARPLFMKPHPWRDWVELEIECGGFNGFLFLSGQFAEAVGKGIGDAEFHINGM